MEQIIEYLRRNVRAIGPRRHVAVAIEAGVSPSLVRKIATGERDNPRIQTIQPLIDYFRAIDSGKRQLPAPDIDPRYLIPRPTLRLRKEAA